MMKIEIHAIQNGYLVISGGRESYSSMLHFVTLDDALEFFGKEAKERFKLTEATNPDRLKELFEASGQSL